MIEPYRSDLFGRPLCVVPALLILCLAAVALRADEAQIRSDCRADALRYCFRDSMRCLRKENEQCRSAVIACMLENRAKLRKDCSRHFW